MAASQNGSRASQLEKIKMIDTTFSPAELENMFQNSRPYVDCGVIVIIVTRDTAEQAKQALNAIGCPFFGRFYSELSIHPHREYFKTKLTHGYNGDPYRIIVHNANYQAANTAIIANGCQFASPSS